MILKAKHKEIFLLGEHDYSVIIDEKLLEYLPELLNSNGERIIISYSYGKLLEIDRDYFNIFLW